MKFFAGSYTFPFQWDQVVAGFWQKYSFLNSKHINSEDVLSRTIVGNQLVTKRLINKSASSAQKVANLLFRKKAKETWVVEESIVDPVQKTMVTYTRNIGLKELASIEEKCIYRINKTNEVVQEKYAWIDSKHVYFGGIIQKLVLQHFKRRAGKSSAELHTAITKLLGTDSGNPSGIAPLLKENDLRGKAIRATKSVAQKAPKPPIIV